MHVSSTGPASSFIHASHTAPATRRNEHPKSKHTSAPHPENAPVTDAPAPQSDSADLHEPGVIRLLQAGHFKGVADIRLRINFADRLAQSQARQQQAAASDQTDQLLATVDEQLAHLIDSGLLTDEQAAAVTQLGSDFANSFAPAAPQPQSNGPNDYEADEHEFELDDDHDDAPFSAADFLSSIQTKTTDLLAALQNLLAPPAAPEEIPADPLTDPAAIDDAAAPPAPPVEPLAEQPPAPPIEPLDDPAALTDPASPTDPGAVAPVADPLLDTPTDPATPPLDTNLLAGTPSHLTTDVPTELAADPLLDMPLDPATPTDPLAPPDLQTLLSDLGSALTSVVAEITSTFSSLGQLPPLTEPSAHNHGRAYAKFLAIYQQLYPPATTPTPEPTPLDMVA